MKKAYLYMMLAASALLTTSGCATLTAARTRVCDNAEAVKDQAQYAIDHAYFIDDPTKRAAVLAAANLALAAIATCPNTATGPATPGG